MGRRKNTWESYDSKLRKFVNFCTVVVPAAGCEPLCPCPASQATVLAYLGFLQGEDKVHAGSLQPYLSSINQFHSDLGYDCPAIGSLVQLARRGFGELEGELDPDRRRRQALPAVHVWQIMLFGLASSNLHILRTSACIVVQYIFFARGDTSVQALEMDFRLDERGMHWRERTKTLARIDLATLSIPWPAQPGASPHALVRKFFDAMPPKPADSPLWNLPLETKPFASSIVSVWLLELLSLIGVSPPPGVLWSMHSLRSGGATAALSIGVDLSAIARWGLWKEISSVQAYVDALVRASAEAVAFFGHLLKPSSSALAALPPPPLRWGA
jgi:hypothetical protein